MVALLNARLADAVDLRLSIKEAHWNVKGPTFIALHELFDQIQARVDTFTDDIAERAVALAGIGRHWPALPRARCNRPLRVPTCLRFR